MIKICRSLVRLICNGNVSVYRDEVCKLIEWCTVYDLSLTIRKTKELIIDFQYGPTVHQPLLIKGEEVEKATSIKYLVIHISKDLKWSVNATALVKKAQQQMYFLRIMRRSNLSAGLLGAFATTRPSPLLSGEHLGVLHHILVQVLFSRHSGAPEGVSLPPLEVIYKSHIHSRAVAIPSGICSNCCPPEGD